MSKKKKELDKSSTLYRGSFRANHKSSTCADINVLDLFSLPRSVISHPPPLEKPEYVFMHGGRRRNATPLVEKKKIDQV